MKGCKLDNDGDGNCPLHPRGCPPEPDAAVIAIMGDINVVAAKLELLKREIVSEMNQAQRPSADGYCAHIEPDKLGQWVKMLTDVLQRLR